MDFAAEMLAADSLLVSVAFCKSLESYFSKQSIGHLLFQQHIGVFIILRAPLFPLCPDNHPCTRPRLLWFDFAQARAPMSHLKEQSRTASF